MGLKNIHVHKAIVRKAFVYFTLLYYSLFISLQPVLLFAMELVVRKLDYLKLFFCLVVDT